MILRTLLKDIKTVTVSGSMDVEISTQSMISIPSIVRLLHELLV